MLAPDRAMRLERVSPIKSGRGNRTLGERLLLADKRRVGIRPEEDIVDRSLDRGHGYEAHISVWVRL
jgi:hypothetical protein